MSLKFTDQEVLEHINEIFAQGETRRKVSLNDIANPSTEFVKAIMVDMLMEVGFSNRILDIRALQIPQPLLEPNCALNINETIPMLSLVNAARYFFDLVGGAVRGDVGKIDEATPFRFGVNDLIAPEPKRIKFFMKQFINYFLFCNMHYPTFAEVSDRVDAIKADLAEKENKRHEFELQINRNRDERASRAVKSEKVQKNIDKVTSQINKLLETMEERKTETESIKAAVAEASADEAKLKETIATLEKTELSLKMMGRHDEIKHELDTELEKLKEEEDSKFATHANLEHRIKELRNENWSALIEETKSIIDLRSALEAEIREKQALLQQDNDKIAQLEELEIDVANLEKAIAGVQADIAAMEKKWKTTKAMKVDHVNEYKTAIDEKRKAMQEDDIVHHELQAQIESLLDELKVLEEQKDSEIKHVESKATELSEAFKHFMSVMESDANRLRKEFKTLKELTI